MDPLPPIPDFDKLQTAHDRARTVVDELLCLPASTEFSAQQVLVEHPELNDFPSCVLDIAYEEFCRCREAGQNVPATAFAKRFPNVQQSLYRVIEFDQILHQHPSLIDDVPEESWPEVGDQFGEFQLLEQIGRGAMSRVFLARQPCLGGRQVVVKVCVRGEREADLLGQLDHSGIAPVHSVHTDPTSGLATLCMPFLTRATMHHLAETLSGTQPESKHRQHMTAVDLAIHVHRINSGNANRCQPDSAPSGPVAESSVSTSALSQTLSLPPSDRFATVVMRWGVQLATALQHAHDRSILHCDVKPGNVLLMPDLSVRVLDFNLAWASQDALKLAGGTLPYMASEQLLALDRTSQIHSNADDSCEITDRAAAETQHIGQVSERTDVFGLCATLCHVVTGEPPYGVTVDESSRSSAANVMLQRQYDGLPPETVARLREVLPPEAVALLVSGLNVDPERRPASADALAEQFTAMLPESQPGMSRQQNRIRRWAIGLSIASAVVLMTHQLTRPTIDPGATAPRQQDSAATTNRPGGVPGNLPDLEKTFEVSGIQLARQHLRRNEFSAALEVLTSLEEPTAESHFLELYGRTCLLPNITYEAPGPYFQLRQRLAVKQDSAADLGLNQSLVNQSRQPWLEMAAEWQSLTNTDFDAPAVWWNLACVYLELDDLQSVQECVLNAQRAGLSDEQGRRLLLILQLLEAHTLDQFSNESLLQQLRENGENAGTRGEILAWLNAAIHEVRSQPGLSTAERHRRALHVAEIFREPEIPLEPEAIWKVMQVRSITQNTPLLRDLFELSEFPRTAQRNRLDTILMLPTDSADQPATAVVDPVWNR